MDQQKYGGGRAPRGRGRSTSRSDQPHQPQAPWVRPGVPPSRDDSYGPPSVGRTARIPTPYQAGSSGDRAPGQQQPSTSTTASAAVGGSGDQGTRSLGRGTMRGSKIISEILTRPAHTQKSKKGNIGQPINLEANFFKVLNAPNWCLFQYRVDFSPEEDRNVVRKGLLRLHKERLGTYMFDGTVMYTCNRYAGVTATEPMKLFSERTSDQAKIEITIRLVGEMARGDPHYLQLFNIILRRGFEHLRLQLVGRNYFDPAAKIEIREYRFELWPGYQSTIRQHEHNVLMGVEITSKVMRQETLLEILSNVRQRAASRGGSDVQAMCRAEVIGLTVLTDYNNNTYRVEDIDFNNNPTKTFPMRNKGEISYIDYYKQKYNITIRNPTQPLLITRPSLRDRRAGRDEDKDVCLIPELCRATGLTDSMRNDFRLMNALAEHTRIRPDGRINRLMAFNRRLNSQHAVVQEFKQWNLELDQRLLQVPARVLPTENIVLYNNKQESAGREANWTRIFKNSRLIVCAKLSDWVVIFPNRLKRDADSFIQNIIRVGVGMSFAVSQPSIRELRSDSARDYVEELESVMRQKNPQLVCCIAMRQRADIYSAIKQKCCVDRPVPSQVILAKNLSSKGAMSVATKVAIQMNCKIGGAAWSVPFGLSGLMVVGFDVCHDPNRRGTDYGAMVASLDPAMVRYFSAVSAHKSNEELTNEFGINMIKALRKYAELNDRTYPQRIIIYRDGVGDGQIPYVLEHELKNLQEQLGKFYTKEQPLKLAFIIVTKRINVRLFYNKRDNPPPGTVVDDVITNPCRYDFFIVSQCVNKGSVSPTAYNVIYDNAGLDVSAIQQLTYRLTHMYYNWSGTIRVPAPCQYAHKLAFLVSQSIHKQPSSHLENLLYFL